MMKLNHIVAIAGGVIAIAGASLAMGIHRSKYVKYEKEYNAGVERVNASYPKLPEQVFFDDGFVTYNADGDDVASSKSSFKKSQIYFAHDAVVRPLSEATAQQYKKVDDTPIGEYISGLDRRGGEITFTINTENYGMSDIEVGMKTNRVDDKGVYHPLENLSDYIKIQINGLDLKTEELELSDDNESFSQLVLKNTFLLKGTNTVTFTTSAYNDFGNKNDVLYVMPDISNVTVLTDVDVIPPLQEE